LREQLPEARRALGEEHEINMKLRRFYACCLYKPDGASRDEVVEATNLFEALSRMTRRVFGPAHPFTTKIQKDLKNAQEQLTSFDTP